MNMKFKKYVIPAIAATIIGGGASGTALVFASSKDKPVEQQELSEKQESAALEKKAKLTEAESKKIALEKVPGTVKEVELEDEDGTVVYSVNVQAKDGSKQEVKIDAQTGKVLKVESDDEEGNGKEENDDQDQAALAKKAKLTEAESKKIALEKVPGTVKDVELEVEDGTVVYGVEVQAKDGSKQDVKIDAKTGEILKVDMDDEDSNENDDE
ncbi:PepSY domain-containing protein [Peribacillus butanolivorans]|uniref:PepSY domain-containing protein n=1 Tax=Peribacillus butanolivorans TaxID=421767 RepID=UPI0036887827